ncbi:MAG: tRNA (guanosine(46)-N7)-methyltransferase TrmB, partial [Clostridia bacterium]|nr:tRNA (guanosine(46)-N7)-methyltransferase TrmB [Clostridia bacterium]
YNIIMRMHKKGHLEERIAACGDIVTVADLSDKNMKRAALTPEYIAFNGVFGNDNPICLEIGCGKGKFVAETAARNKNLNFIAVEKISNVLIEALERVKGEKLKNVYFLNCAAEVLEKYIKAGSIEKIYLNFSNPLPKEGYKKQRLTHPRFLEIYKRLLKPNGKIIQKTDDKDFYLFSLESYKKSGFEILETCEDLAAHPVAGDVETEHEKRFKEQGKPIFRIVAEVK